MDTTGSILEYVAQAQDLGTFLERVLIYGTDRVHAKAASVFFFDPASRWLRLLKSSDKIEPFELAEGQGVAGAGHKTTAGRATHLFEGEELRQAYASDRDSPTRALKTLTAILTVSAPLVGEAGLTFCFDFHGDADCRDPLSEDQRKAGKALAEELLSRPVLNALRRAWVSQWHQEIRAAGLLPEQLRQRADELVAQLRDGFRDRGAPLPDAFELQLVDPQRSIIRSFLNSDQPLGFEDAWTHKLDSDDIQAHLIRTQCPELIVGWDPRFDPRIYKDRHHERLTRLWVPLLPFEASLPAFLPSRLVEKEVQSRLRWVAPEPDTPQRMWRRAEWTSRPPPEGAAYGTLSVSFRRLSEKRLELLPWTEELATRCIHEIWRLAAKLYPATLSGVFENIGRCAFALGAAQSMVLATPGSEPMSVGVRTYPYELEEPWRLPRYAEFPQGEPLPQPPTAGPGGSERLDLKPGDLIYEGRVGSIQALDLEALRRVTKDLVGSSVEWAVSLHERQLAVFASHDSLRAPWLLLGTERSMGVASAPPRPVARGPRPSPRGQGC